MKAGDADGSGDVCALWVRGLRTESPHSHSGLRGPLSSPTPVPRSRHTHRTPATEQPKSTLPERPSQHRLIPQAQTQSAQMLALTFILSAASRVELHLKLRNTWLLFSLQAPPWNLRLQLPWARRAKCLSRQESKSTPSPCPAFQGGSLPAGP